MWYVAMRIRRDRDDNIGTDVTNGPGTSLLIRCGKTFLRRPTLCSALFPRTALASEVKANPGGGRLLGRETHDVLLMHPEVPAVAVHVVRRALFGLAYLILDLV